MAPVTVDTSAISGGGSGNTGWSAKDTFFVPVRDQQSLTQTYETGFGSPNLVQSFTPGFTQDLNDIWVRVAIFSGTPTDLFWIDIETDNSDTPSGTSVGTSDLVDLSGIVSFPSYQWVRFQFPTPPSLTGGTKYWIVPNRQGGSAVVYVKFSAANDYAGGVLKEFVGGSWTTPNPSFDFNFVTGTTPRLYRVTQDAELHVWESTDDGASWAELDAGNGPAVNSSTKPFSADTRLDEGTTGHAIDITCVLFTGTNTIRGWDFNLDTRLWDTTALQSADASNDANFNRNVRVIARASETVISYTSVADDADLEYVRRTTGAWGSQISVLAANSTEASCYSDVIEDDGGYIQMLYHDVAGDDFEVRSLIGTTLGTLANIDDTTAADVETEHASANYAVYDDAGTDKVIAAFIASNGSLVERVLSIGVTSASISMATRNAVSASTSYAGRSLLSCYFDGDRHIFACTGSQIDHFTDVGGTGSWTAETGWVTGLTNAVLSGPPVPIDGVGILVSYTSNGNAIINIWAPTATEHPLTGASQGSSLASVPRITEAHAMSGSVAGSSTADVPRLRLAQPLTGSVAGDSTASATRIIEPHAMAGSSPGSSTAAATRITESHAMAGSVVASSGAAGTLLGATHALTGSSAGSAAAAASLEPIPHALSGVSAGASASSATRIILTDHSLSGVIAGAGLATGSLLAQAHPLEGSSAGVGLASATQITESHALAGSAAGVGTADALRIVEEHPLSGSSAGVGSASGSIQGSGAVLTGTSAGSSTAAASLEPVSHALDGSAAGSSTAEALRISQEHAMSGSAAGASTGAALRIVETQDLSGSAAGSAQADALRIILTAHPLSGIAAGSSLLDGSLSGSGAVLTGSSAGGSSATASIAGVAHALSGLSAGASAATASGMVVSHPLSGAIFGASEASAIYLGLTHPLSGESTGTSHAEALRLILEHPLAGAAAGSSQADALQIVVEQALQGVAFGESDAEIARIIVGHILSGDSQGAAIVTALLGSSFLPTFVIDARRRVYSDVDARRPAPALIDARRTAPDVEEG